MLYEARKFNQKSYNENDEYAKNKFKEFIKKRGYEIINDKENYEHDLIVKKDDKTIYFELEVKRNYPFTTMESFKFPTVSFLGRKKRLHDITEFIYIIICKETEWAVTCKSKDIYNDLFVEKLDIKTSDRQGKDLFYRVPKEKCKFFDLNKS